MAANKKVTESDKNTPDVTTVAPAVVASGVKSVELSVVWVNMEVVSGVPSVEVNVSSPCTYAKNYKKSIIKWSFSHINSATKVSPP